MSRHSNTPEWVRHIAFALGEYDEFLVCKTHLGKSSVDVLGPVDQGCLVRSAFSLRARAKAVADEMLEEWSRVKKAPRRAAWLHSRALKDR